MRRWRMEAVRLCVCQLHRLTNIPQNTPVFVHKVKYSLWVECVVDQVSNSHPIKNYVQEFFNALLAIRYHDHLVKIVIS